MTISEFRKANNLTLEALAGMIGKTKGHVYAIEQSGKCTAKVALALERVSRGAIDAATLNAEIAEARKIAA